MNVMQQIKNNPNIIGIMMESNLREGKQQLTHKHQLQYGVSITDSCISIEDTEKFILEAYTML